jgi:AbrB family looped-hinge helix DNA binding protein
MTLLTGVAVRLTIILSILIDKKRRRLVEITISSKYQIALPRATRERLELQPGQKLTVLEKDGMIILMPQVKLEDLRGIARGANVSDYRDKKDRH